MWYFNQNRKSKYLDKDLLREFGDFKEFYFSFLDFALIVNKKKKFLIKKVEDANSITKQSYEKLIIMSKITNSVPLIIAEKYNKNNVLKDGVVYIFKDIFVMNENTFYDFLEEEKIYIIKKKNKFKVKIGNKKEKDLFNLNSEEINEIIDKGGFNPFDEKFFEKMDRLFCEIVKKRMKKNKLFGEVIEIKNPIKYCGKNNNMFIKEVYRFDIQKEKRIIDFANFTSSNVIYFSKTNKKVVKKENLLIIPSKLPENEIKEIFEVFLF